MPITHLPIPHTHDKVTCPVGSGDPVHCILQATVKLEDISEQVLDRGQT